MTTPTKPSDEMVKRAFRDWYGSMLPTDSRIYVSFKAGYEAALSALPSRDDVLEEAAQIIEQTEPRLKIQHGTEPTYTVEPSIYQLAASIRALKSAAPQIAGTPMRPRRRQVPYGPHYAAALSRYRNRPKKPSSRRGVHDRPTGPKP